jgi:hypothetical protein
MQKLHLEKIPAVKTNLIQISKVGQYVKEYKKGGMQIGSDFYKSNPWS